MDSDPTKYHSKLQRLIDGKGLESSDESDEASDESGESGESGESWGESSMDSQDALAYEHKSRACAQLFEDDGEEGDFEGFEKLE